MWDDILRMLAAFIFGVLLPYLFRRDAEKGLEWGYASENTGGGLIRIGIGAVIAIALTFGTIFLWNYGLQEGASGYDKVRNNQLPTLNTAQLEEALAKGGAAMNVQMPKIGGGSLFSGSGSSGGSAQQVQYETVKTFQPEVFNQYFPDWLNAMESAIRDGQKVDSRNDILAGITAVVSPITENIDPATGEPCVPNYWVARTCKWNATDETIGYALAIQFPEGTVIDGQTQKQYALTTDQVSFSGLGVEPGEVFDGQWKVDEVIKTERVAVGSDRASAAADTPFGSESLDPSKQPLTDVTWTSDGAIGLVYIKDNNNFCRNGSADGTKSGFMPHKATVPIFAAYPGGNNFVLSYGTKADGTKLECYHPLGTEPNGNGSNTWAYLVNQDGTRRQWPLNAEPTPAPAAPAEQAAPAEEVAPTATPEPAVDVNTPQSCNGQAAQSSTINGVAAFCSSGCNGKFNTSGYIWLDHAKLKAGACVLPGQ